MCRELLGEPAGAAAEAVMEAYFVHHDEPFGKAPCPAPSPHSPDSPTSGHSLESCHAGCRSPGVREDDEGAAAAVPFVTAA